MKLRGIGFVYQRTLLLFGSIYDLLADNFGRRCVAIAERAVFMSEQPDKGPSLFVRTLLWRRGHTRWDASFDEVDGPGITFVCVSSSEINAVQGHERWRLYKRLLTLEVELAEKEETVAVLKHRIFAPSEIRFADGRLARVEPLRSFKLMPDHVKFVDERQQPLLTVSNVFQPLRDSQIRLAVTDAGIAFPFRTILEVLGIYLLMSKEARD